MVRLRISLLGRLRGCRCYVVFRPFKQWGPRLVPGAPIFFSFTAPLPLAPLEASVTRATGTLGRLLRAPLAQLDRASASGAEGQWFESTVARSS